MMAPVLRKTNTMVENRLQVIEFLKQLHLFYGLNEQELSDILDHFDERVLDMDERIVAQGDPSDSFFIIYKGSVRVTRQYKSRDQLLATLVAGDYFGEEGLLFNHSRTATVTTLAPSILFELDKSTFFQLLRRHSDVKEQLLATVESYRLSREHSFDWLGENEVVYLAARKHETILILSLIGPVLIGLFSVPFFFISSIAGILTPSLLGVLIFLFAFAWGIWKWIDWGNDFYIVTNQRVVWLEKVIGLYDSRQEAPLSTILAVSVETDAFGRVFGYGDVIVRTYTGKIVMRNVGRPEEMAAHIEEYWQRTKKSSRKAEEQAMVSAIRERLGLPEKRGTRDQFIPQTPEPETAPSIRKSSPLKLLLISFFSTRFVDGSIITYRKHWFLLARKVWWQTLAISAILFIIIGRQFGLFDYLSPRSVWVVGLSILTVLAGYWLYEFIDWRNDMYQVTADHIVDIDRKPLGREEKKSAPIENILSLEHERVGITGILMNFGHVSATVGGSKFIFEGVDNPALVQQDIFRKMEAVKKRKREAEAARERARMSAWLAAYHRNAQEFKEQQETQTEIDEESLSEF